MNKEKEIEIFIRHCNFSTNSVGKNRPKWFSREKCFENLIRTSCPTKVNITICFDGENVNNHFLNEWINKSEWNELFNLKINFSKGGDDARSFLNMINYVEKQDLNPETIIYFLEDDYLHKDDWDNIMMEGFGLGAEYVTLYDHKDKYFLPMYHGLKSQVFMTESSHWRTAVSTTNTYACKFKTLKKHIDIHRQFCDLKKGFTKDHDKFMHLWSVGSNLISPIPGWSTHCETEYLSPCVDWEEYSK